MSNELKALELKHTLENLLFAMRMNRLQNDIEIYNLIISKKCSIKEWDESAKEEQHNLESSESTTLRCAEILRGVRFIWR